MGSDGMGSDGTGWHRIGPDVMSLVGCGPCWGRMVWTSIGSVEMGRDAAGWMGLDRIGWIWIGWVGSGADGVGSDGVELGCGRDADLGAHRSMRAGLEIPLSGGERFHETHLLLHCGCRYRCFDHIAPRNIPCEPWHLAEWKDGAWAEHMVL